VCVWGGGGGGEAGARSDKPLPPLAVPAAAGLTINSSNVRSWAGLQRTLTFLRSLYDDDRFSLLSRETFLFDRFRAVRKDMHQQVGAGNWVGAPGRLQPASNSTGVAARMRWSMGLSFTTVHRSRIATPPPPPPPPHTHRRIWRARARISSGGASARWRRLCAGTLAWTLSWRGRTRWGSGAAYAGARMASGGQDSHTQLLAASKRVRGGC